MIKSLKFSHKILLAASLVVFAAFALFQHQHLSHDNLLFLVYFP